VADKTARILLTAEDRTRAAFQSAKAGVEGLQAKYTALTAGISTAFAAIGTANIVNQLDQLNDFEKKTGVAATKIGGIGFAAKQAGGDLESAVNGVGKLNKTLAEAASGSDKALEPFKLLNIEVKNLDGSTKSADQVLIELADKFAELEDGPQKTALAIRIFGKAGADMIPLLDEGGQKLAANIAYFERYSRITPEAVAAADEFNDTMTKLKLLSGALGTELVSRFLPTLQAIADEWVDSKEKGTLYTDVVDGIAVAFRETARAGYAFATMLTIVGKSYGAFIAGLVAVARTGRVGAFMEVINDARTDVEGIVNDFANFSARLGTIGQQVGKTTGDFSRLDRKGRKKQAPGLAADGSSAEELAALKRQLEQQLKAIKEFETDQKLAIDFGNALAKSAYEDGLLTLRSRFRAEQDAREANLKATTDAVNQEISALEAFARNPKVKAADRIDAETKIAELKAQSARAQVKFSQDTVLATQEEARAVQQLDDRYNDLQATILQLQGKTLEAGRVRIEQQARDALKLIGQAGGDPALAAQLKQLLTDGDRLTEVKRQYGLVTDAARIAEERLYLTAKESGQTENDTLTQLGSLRQGQLVQLGKLVTEAQALAEALKSPEAIAFANQLALAFQRAAAEADPVMLKIRDIGKEMGEAIATNAEDAILHWQGARKLLLAIEQDILRIATRKLFTEPLGNFLTGVIGGNGQASGGGGLIGAFSSAIGGLFGGGFASGGTLAAGKWGIVGEHGPEVAYAGAAPLTVYPNSAGGSSNITINQSFAPGTDRRTIMQAAAAAGEQARRGLARNR
jgi:hypothetical protein